MSSSASLQPHALYAALVSVVVIVIGHAHQHALSCKAGKRCGVVAFADLAQGGAYRSVPFQLDYHGRQRGTGFGNKHDIGVTAASGQFVHAQVIVYGPYEGEFNGGRI